MVAQDSGAGLANEFANGPDPRELGIGAAADAADEVDDGQALFEAHEAEETTAKGPGQGGKAQPRSPRDAQLPVQGPVPDRKQERKEPGFSKDEPGKAREPWHKAKGTGPDARGATLGRYHYERRTVVRFRLKPDISKTTPRMGLRSTRSATPGETPGQAVPKNV